MINKRVVNKTSELTEINTNKILLVEGQDECNFFEKLRKELNLGEIEIFDFGGKTQIRSFLKVLKTVSSFSIVDSIGIVRDADTDAKTAFQSIANSLRDVGLSVPDTVLSSAGDKPKVTVMILPGDKSPGMLEDLCLASVKTDVAMSCVENYFSCLKDQQIPSPKNMSKANVQVFIASKPKDVPSLGVAAQKGYWPLDNDVFKQVKQFISSL